MKSLRSLFIGSALALALVANVARAADESPFKFEFHGFVTGSLYFQDQVFAVAQGQGLTFLAPTPANHTGGTLLGGDIRQSRFAFSLSGPEALGGTPRGYLELDLFGGNSAGTFGTESVFPRIRVAYAEMKWGNTCLQAGQQNQLVVPQIPATVAHIANPMTYGAGTIGWRTPGVRLTQSVPIDGGKVDLAVEVVRNKWADAAATATTPATISLGEASGIPMLQARAMLDGKSDDFGYMAYLVGVYHKVKLDGFGGVVALPPAAAGKDSISGYAVELGGKFSYSLVTLALNGYKGKATANMLGGLLRFGDIADIGYWGNLGINFTKEFSIWGLYGHSDVNKEDARLWATNTTPLANDTYGGMVRYMEKGYALAVEGYQSKTKWSTTATTDETTKALQIIVSAGYFF